MTEYTAKKVILKNSKGEYLIPFTDGGMGMPVGTIFPHSASATFVPENSLPCDGHEYSKTQFDKLYTDWLVGKKLETCTYEQYQQELTTTGECLKWGIDTAQGKFKVPTKLNKYVSPNGGGEAPVKGNGMAVGWTDKTHLGSLYWSSQQNTNIATDIYGKPIGTNMSRNGGFNNNQAIGITSDSTKSGIVADLTNAIKTKEIRYFIVVATGSIKQSEMDWSRWASGLEGKLNIDMTNLPVTNDIVVEHKVNPDGSWYRKYKSGWLEQGGRVVGNGTIQTVNLVSPFNSTNYILTGSTESQYMDNSSSYQYVALKANTTTSFKIKTTNTTGSLSKAPVNWYACGQGV